MHEYEYEDLFEDSSENERCVAPMNRPFGWVARTVLKGRRQLEIFWIGAAAFDSISADSTWQEEICLERCLINMDIKIAPSSGRVIGWWVMYIGGAEDIIGAAMDCEQHKEI